MQLRDTLYHYAWVIRRYFQFIGVGVLICTCTTVGISLLLPPVYQASALIIVNGNTNVDPGTHNDIYSNQALAFSYSFLVTKDDVLQAALPQLPGLSVGQLKQAVSDSPISNTPLIEIRAQADSPQQAALIANVVARSFIHIQTGKVSAYLQNQDKQLSLRLLAAQATSAATQAKLIALQAAHASPDDIASQSNLSNTYQANYTALLDSYRRLQLLELQTSDALSISQLAVPPQQPIGPHIWLDAGIAAALSLLLMVVGALLLDWMDETVKTEDDVIRLTALNVLGSVPSYVPPGSDPSEKYVTRTEVVEEAFIAINSALLGQCEGKCSIMITGLRSACGTSTVAANLAVALARSGKRVLLIDTNFRRPVLHARGFQYFHTQSLFACLAELRRSAGTRQQIVNWLNQWRTRTPYLWLLPAGPVSSRPAALLSVPELRVLVQELLASQLIDMLILDSAGLNEGADALTIASVTDTTILVIEAGKEKKEDLDRARATLERFNSPVLGVIINRWHNGLRSYFYTERTRVEHLKPPVRLRVSQTAAQMPLSDTPRPQVLISERTSNELRARVIPSETPPPLVRIPLSVSKLSAAESTSKEIRHGIRYKRMLRVVPPKHKGIIMPVGPYEETNGSKEHGLGLYMNSSRQKQ